MKKIKFINEADKTENLTVACGLQVDRIIALLHLKALQDAQSKNKNILIENTAVEGDNPKSAKFHGAGEHMISVKSTDEDTNISQEDAFKVIQTYINSFVGPDIGKELKQENLFPLQDNAADSDGGSSEDSDEVNDDGSDEETSQNESVFNTSFLDFMNLNNRSRFLNEVDDEDEDDDQHDDDGEADDTDDDGDESVDAEDDDNNDDNDNADEDGNGKDGDEDGNGKDGDEDGNGEGTAPGYAITYKLGIKGESEHKLKDAIKSFGSGFLQNFGIRLIDGWGQNGETISAKKITDELGAVFGNIDLKTFKSAYETNLNRKFKEAANYINISVWDTEVIKRYCREWINAADMKAISAAKYAVTTKIDKREKTPELFTKKVIAEVMTSSILGAFKKKTKGIKEKDVIFIKNYTDDLKDKNTKKFKQTTKDKLDSGTPDEEESVKTNESLIDFIKKQFVTFIRLDENKQIQINKKLFGDLFEDIDISDYQSLFEDGEENSEEKKSEEKKSEENSEEKKSEENSEEKKSEEKKSEENPEEKKSEENPEEKKSEENPEEKKSEENSNNKSKIKIKQIFKDKIRKEFKSYIDELNGDLEDNDLKDIKIISDFEIGDVKIKKDQDIKKKDFMTLINAMAKANDKDFDRFFRSISSNDLNSILNITGSGSENGDFDDSDEDNDGETTQWFMYIVPMPGAFFSDEDVPDTESSPNKG